MTKSDVKDSHCSLLAFFPLHSGPVTWLKPSLTGQALQTLFYTRGGKPNEKPQFQWLLSLSSFSICLFFETGFQNLCSSGCLGTPSVYQASLELTERGLPASASKVLGLKVWVTTAWQNSYLPPFVPQIDHIQHSRMEMPQEMVCGPDETREPFWVLTWLDRKHKFSKFVTKQICNKICFKNGFCSVVQTCLLWYKLQNEQRISQF